MINITEYDDTGALTCLRAFSDEETYDLNSDNPHVMGSYSAEDYYVVDGQPTERPASPVTLSDLTLQGVPAGSTLTIASASLSTSNGESYPAEGDVELEFPLSGTYRLRVECWPYKDWEGEVVV